MSAILEVRDLKTYFHRKDGIIKAVDGISYTLNQGDSLAIVGESGSGKSVSVTSIMGLIKTGKKASMNGEIIFKDKNFLKLSGKQVREIRGNEISMIFQDPMSSLNPTMKIGEQIIEPLLWHKKISRKEAKKIGIEMLEKVGIPSPEMRFNSYPFEFSGGMRQRVMIAMALICNPSLLIADEPTTALDVTVQAQILGLMQDIKEENNTSVILITHDLAVASSFCNQIAVMYAGKIAEKAGMEKFIKNPLHPYSNGLLKSTPVMNDSRETLEAIKGQPPNLKKVPPGCPFSPRCEKCMEKCKSEIPPLFEVDENHTVACWLYESW